MGIEPTALAWEARVLPLYDARRERNFTRNTPSTATLPGSTEIEPSNHNLGSHPEHGHGHGQPRDDHQQYLDDHEQQDRR